MFYAYHLSFPFPVSWPCSWHWCQSPHLVKRIWLCWHWHWMRGSHWRKCSSIWRHWYLHSRTKSYRGQTSLHLLALSLAAMTLCFEMTCGNGIQWSFLNFPNFSRNEHETTFSFFDLMDVVKPLFCTCCQKVLQCYKYFQLLALSSCKTFSFWVYLSHR